MVVGPRFIGLFIFVCGSVSAQTTAFTYQGRLTQSGHRPMFIRYAFRLFDCRLAGADAAWADTYLRRRRRKSPAVAVTSGIFTVQLDFNSPSPCATCFTGADRYLEVASTGGERPAVTRRSGPKRLRPRRLRCDLSIPVNWQGSRD